MTVGIRNLNYVSESKIASWLVIEEPKKVNGAPEKVNF